MAKIVITIQDSANGGVEITATPKFSELMSMVLGEHSQITSAHGYAVSALNHLIKVSKLAKHNLVVPTKSEIEKLLDAPYTPEQ